MAQTAQATFEIPAEALEFQPQVFPAERGEVLHQQPLATGKRLPVQAPPRVARLVGAQSLVVVDARARQRAPLVLGILRARREERLAGQRPRVDQRLLAQVDPAPGHQQAEGKATLHPQAPRPQPAASLGRVEQQHLGSRVACQVGVFQRPLRPADGDGLARPPRAFQAHPETGALAGEHRVRSQRGEAQAGKVAIGMEDGHHAQGQQQEGQPVGQAVLVVDRRQQHHQQRQTKSAALAGRQDEYAALVQLDAARRRYPPVQPALPARPVAQAHQSAGTSRSSHCTSAPPPCPVGSAWSRRRCPATAGNTAWTSSGIT